MVMPAAGGDRQVKPVGEGGAQDISSRPALSILHYSSPPIVGGVEAVILAHARLFRQDGYPLTVIAGRGDRSALPPGTDFISIPEIDDSQDPAIAAASRELEQGRVPPDFDALVQRLVDSLAPILPAFDHTMVHNVFTKHFNLPLTAALFRLLDAGRIPGCIAWCHDFTWTSPHSRSRVFPGYPWDLLRTYRPDITYVTVSKSRQKELADLLGAPVEAVKVVYNGVDSGSLLNFSPKGQLLAKRLGLLESDLNLLMPVRVTQAKNIELGIDLAAALKESGCRLRLVVTGPPDPHDEGNIAYYRSLLDLRRKRNVEEEVHFVYESGPDPQEAFLIDDPLVAELYQLSDVVFVPSHREGFGIPVLEAGLLGRPVWCTAFPAAVEIGYPDVVLFEPDTPPQELAGDLLKWARRDPVYRLRKRVRQNFTWGKIFEREIEPLVKKGIGDKG